MLRSLYAGISGMKVNQVKLDVIGNNIANAGTTAFKSSRVRFKDMVSQTSSEAVAPGISQGGINPKQVGLGVQVAGIDSMVEQGSMQPTSRVLDVAIDGEGYLVVGSGADTSYTRDGALTQDKNGALLNSDGLTVMGYSITGAAGLEKAGTDLVALTIPDAMKGADGKDHKVKSFSIEEDGVIKGFLDDNSVVMIGQIAMASFKNPAGLSKVGGNLYQSTSNSGAAVMRSGIGAATDNSKSYGSMLSQMLEMSNVDLAEQFTDMIIAQRAFQASGKSITTGDEILQEILALKR